MCHYWTISISFNCAFILKGFVSVFDNIPVSVLKIKPLKLSCLFLQLTTSFPEEMAYMGKRNAFKHILSNLKSKVKNISFKMFLKLFPSFFLNKRN